MDGRMNKDVKIGLAIGLLALIAVFCLFALNFGRSPASRPEPAQPEQNAGGGGQTRSETTVSWPEVTSPEGDDRMVASMGGAERLPAVIPPEPGATDLAVNTTPATIDPRARGINPETERLRQRVEQGPPAGGSTSDVIGVGPDHQGSMPPPLPATPQTYKVAQNDTLISISRKVYGSGRFYKKIMEANHITDDRRLREGQTLTIPPVGNAERDAGTTTTAGMEPRAETITLKDGEKSYTVQPRDTVIGISRKFYGTGRYSKMIMEANGIKDEKALREGQKLVIPAKPAETGVAGGTTAGPLMAGEQPYVVKPNDTAESISLQFYQTRKHYDLILKRNNIAEGRLLRAGEPIIIPVAPAGTATALMETRATD